MLRIPRVNVGAISGSVYVGYRGEEGCRAVASRFFFFFSTTLILPLVSSFLSSSFHEMLKLSTTSVCNTPLHLAGSISIGTRLIFPLCSLLFWLGCKFISWSVVLTSKLIAPRRERASIIYERNVRCTRPESKAGNPLVAVAVRTLIWALQTIASVPFNCLLIPHCSSRNNLRSSFSY